MSACRHDAAQGANPEFAPHLTGSQVQCADCGVIFPNDRAWLAAIYGEPYDDTPLECLDDHDGRCEGEVAYHQNPYSDSFKAWPRCDKHYEAYTDRMQALAQRYPVNAPSDFDPSYAGEVWSEEDY